MTRFARAEGSKSSNKKVPEDATPWKILKGDNSSLERNVSSEKYNSLTLNQGQKNVKSKATVSDKSNLWSVMSNPSEESAPKEPKKSVKRCIDDGEDESSSSKKPLPYLNSSGWRLSDSDKLIIDELKNKLLKDGASSNVINDEIKLKISKLRRKNFKSKKCFNCQKVGHFLSDCPEKNETDICFICGSSEHKFRNCKQKKNNHDKFAYATCFICKEQGHISTSCPDNPSGLYPYGGGCHECGDVTHFSRDCPKLKKETKNQFTLSTISNDVEGLPEDAAKTAAGQRTKKVKIVNF